MGSRTQTTYINAIEDSCSRFPDLYKLSYYLKGRHRHPSRAAVLQFGSGRSSRVERFDFKSVNDLEAYFSHTARSACKHRLCLLEDLSRPFIEAFGAHFWMDPFLFAAHENSTHWTGSSHSYALPRRLSPSENCDPLFTLRYYEVVRFPTGGIRSVSFKTVSNVRRKIEAGDYFFEKENSKTTVYVIRRNASFWSRARKDGGWDALILVDPPVGDSILDGNDQIQHWPNQLYGHGYVDFTPWSVNNPYLRGDDVGRGPTRTSIFEDIIWYWSRAANDEQISNVQNDMAMGAIFLKKIVASNWNVMLEFVWAKLSEFERALGSPKVRGTGGQQEPLDQLAEILTAVSLFRRRLLWYLDEVESSLRSAGVNVDKESDDEGKELLSVLRRLQGFKEKVESLTSVVTGMLSVRQADMSQMETKLVSRLTLVALVFIPLSFTASIFSMGGDFLPGSSRFWVYFAAAVPMTFMVLALAWLLRGQTWI